MSKLVIVLAFANEAATHSAYLRNVREEQRRLHNIWDPLVADGRCTLVELPSATVEEIFKVFLDPRYHGRIALFHYGGHADSGGLFLETAQGDTALAHAGGLSRFLGRQPGLQLVFLNGCSTQPQVQMLQDAGVPVVVATSRAIDDAMAVTFAERFYSGLVNHISLQEAFAAADDFVETLKGHNFRTLYRNVLSMDEDLLLAPDRAPWDLYIRRGAEEAAGWNLPEALDDPLLGLPPLPPMDLPLEPFRSILWFEREHAPIFFGRGHDILSLYRKIQAREGEPIILLHGQSGIGKSSLLAAGLLPRLEQDYQVVYRRRDPNHGLAADLDAALHRAPGMDIRDCWHAQEAAKPADGTPATGSKPLVVLLDQVEEIFTRPNEKLASEMADFLDRIEAIFHDRAQRPCGRLILSFRKEWLAEIGKLLHERKLPYTDHFLTRLSRSGIIEAITGPARPGRLQEKYHLQVDAGVDEEIADDLLVDAGSALAPTLQILLAKLWSRAVEVNQFQPHFTKGIYHELQGQGLLLIDFLREQMTKLAEKHQTAVDSGLALDLLYFHTTDLGTAARREREELQTEYQDKEAQVVPLVAACRDLYLLVEVLDDSKANSTPATQLAHDTLAPLVRREFDYSGAVGQRARRILETSARINAQHVNHLVPLGEIDLKLVEEGRAGMRVWREWEKALVATSQDARRVRRAEVQRQEARRLADYSISVREESLSCSLLLSLEAIALTLHEPEGAIPTALQNLRHTLAQPLGLPLEGHNDWISKIAFSPDGKWLASGGKDKTVCLWHADKPEEEPLLLHGHTNWVYSLTFSPDSHWLASADNDGTIYLWNMGNPSVSPIPLQKHTDWVSVLVFSPDGKWLASGGRDQNVFLWDMKDLVSAPVHLQGHTDWVRVLVFSPDGTWLASGGKDPAIRLWNIAEPTVPPTRLLGHTDRVRALVFSPDGKILASGGDDKSIYLWDVGAPTSAPTPLTEHTDWITTLAFRPDSQMLASGDSGGTVRLTSVNSLTPASLVLADRTSWIHALAFSPDGGFLASGSDDATVRLWDMAYPYVPPKIYAGHTEPVRTLAFSSDSKRLASGGGDRTARFWNLAFPIVDPVVIQGYSSWHGTVAFASSAPWLATHDANGVVWLWDTNELAVTSLPPTENSAAIQGLLFSHDGKWLAANDVNGAVWLWDTNALTGTPLLLKGNSGFIQGIDFSHDGKWLASYMHEGSVYLWDLNEPMADCRLVQSYTNNIVALAFDSSGRWLAAKGINEEEENVWLWDMAKLAFPIFLTKASGGADEALDWSSVTNPNLIEVNPNHGRLYDSCSLSFSPDGKWLASGDINGRLYLWDITALLSIPTVLSRNWRGTLVFSSDSKWLAFDDYQDTVQLWDLNTASYISTPVQVHWYERGSTALAFSPDSKWLAIGSGYESQIYLCSMAYPTVEPIVLPNRIPGLNTLLFSSDNKWLAATDHNGTVCLWHMDLKELINLAKRYTGRNFTWREWNRYFRGEPYRKTCDQWPIAPDLPQEELDRIQEAQSNHRT